MNFIILPPLTPYLISTDDLLNIGFKMPSVVLKVSCFEN